LNSGKFFAELKRRNVYKVAVAYIVAGWALSQGIAQVLPVFNIPNGLIRLFVVLIIIGFPIALIFAWAFEITPQGIKRAEDVDLSKPHTIRGPWIYIVLVGAAVSISLFFLGRYTAPNRITSTDENKSIAVLPFATLSDDRNDAYFADGVQDQILTNLAKVSDLKVISHTSVRQYKSGSVSRTLWKGRSSVRVIAFASTPN
jgi:phage shock protein PspC (stress-responsive transcriptional regulator)